MRQFFAELPGIFRKIYRMGYLKAADPCHWTIGDMALSYRLYLSFRDNNWFTVRKNVLMHRDKA